LSQELPMSQWLIIYTDSNLDLIDVAFVSFTTSLKTLFARHKLSSLFTSIFFKSSRILFNSVNCFVMIMDFTINKVVVSRIVYTLWSLYKQKSTFQIHQITNVFGLYKPDIYNSYSMNLKMKVLLIIMIRGCMSQWLGHIKRFQFLLQWFRSHFNEI